MPPTARRPLQLPAPGTRRAVVIGAGSFGTAVAVLLARGGLRTTLQTRTREQADRLREDRQNSVYLPGVEFPRELRVDHADTGLARADYVFLGVPSAGLDEVIASLPERELPDRAAVVSLAKGLAPPHGTPPTVLLRRRLGASRTACVGGPAHAREMVSEGAALVAASTDPELARALAGVFMRAGVVCEESYDPVGVELSGVAKNAAALASGATEAQGLNAAGAAAGHIFAEVWRWAEAHGGRPESMIGLAGTGDLVATALAPESRNRRAGELLAQGVPASEIPARVGQAVESLETVPLLASALNDAALESPVTTALARLIRGELPLEEWVAVVRTTVPAPARWRPAVRPGFWQRLRERLRRLFRRPRRDDSTTGSDEAPLRPAEPHEAAPRQPDSRQPDSRQPDSRQAGPAQTDRVQAATGAPMPLGSGPQEPEEGDSRPSHKIFTGDETSGETLSASGAGTVSERKENARATDHRDGGLR